MDHTTIAKVTAAGQVSLPAAVRKRWNTAQVVMQDQGDCIIVRPLPNDPIEAACGSLARRGPVTAAVRAAERRAAASREGRRRRR